MDNQRSISPRRSRRPSPAMIVALVALTVAMSGTAVAASNVLITSSKQIKNGVIGTADLSKKARTSLTGKAGKAGPAGATGAAGATGPAGTAGATGPTGPSGKNGADGSAVAYARINATGTVSAGKAISAANVVIGNSAGLYCFRNLSFTPHNIQASVAYNGSGNAHTTAQVEIGVPIGNVCPDGTVAFVKTYNNLDGQTAESFFVSFN